MEYLFAIGVPLLLFMIPIWMICRRLDRIAGLLEQANHERPGAAAPRAHKTERDLLR